MALESLVKNPKRKLLQDSLPSVRRPAALRQKAGFNMKKQSLSFAVLLHFMTIRLVCIAISLNS